VLENERPRILAEADEGLAGGHYTGKATAQDYDGQRFTETQKSIVRDAMSIKG
jgi:hypothetical protein